MDTKIDPQNARKFLNKDKNCKFNYGLKKPIIFISHSSKAKEKMER
jgi:hypothetical protein